MNITVALTKARPPLHTYEPLLQHNLNLNGVHLVVALYGSRHGDWSSRQFGLPPEQSGKYCGRVGAVLRDQHARNVRVLVLPSQFNARMAGPEHFQHDGIHAGGHILYRNAKYPGEGLLLEPGQTAWLTPSNCGTGILILDGRCTVVHFGRWSLFDRQMVEHGRRDVDREHESILYAALESLGVRTQEDAARVVAILCWGAHPGDFPHPIIDSPHATINQSLHKHLRADLGIDPVVREGKYYGLDLLRCARFQLNKRGVPHKNINTNVGYLPRDGVWHNGAPGEARNGVLIVRGS